MRLRRPRFEEGMVSQVVNYVDNQRENARVTKGKGQYTHLSSLIDFCPRMQVLARDHNVQPITRGATGGHRVMWRIGRAVEAHIREQYIRGTDWNNVLGTWKCNCGQIKHENTHYDHKWRSCKSCRSKPRNYVEMGLLDHEHKVVGSPDMVLFTGTAGYLPVEIKSMNAEQFATLEAPVPDHVFQVLGYQKLLRVSGYQVHPNAILIYCVKDFRWGSPYKEFTIDPRNFPHVVQQIDEAFLRAKAIHETDGLPPRMTACGSPTDTRPKQCPLLAQCFMRG
mgnify:CR=1 FL=1